VGGRLWPVWLGEGGRAGRVRTAAVAGEKVRRRGGAQDRRRLGEGAAAGRVPTWLGEGATTGRVLAAAGAGAGAGDGHGGGELAAAVAGQTGGGGEKQDGRRRR
jgi:hypothetical protein